MKTRFLLLSLLLLSGLLSLSAQPPVYGKMSSKVRQIALNQESAQRLSEKSSAPHRRLSRSSGQSERLMAFVRIDGDAERILATYGCRSYAQWGSIYVVDIPLFQLNALSASPSVLRIEAGNSCQAQLDMTAKIHQVLPIYNGENLPAKYTGKGVVVGLQDIGFDLTHPTFLNSEGTATRICRFWDQLSIDTLDSRMPVGQEYTTPREIIQYAHSRDGEEQWHGTHTAGIAVGNGAGSSYRGLAYESDICLVSNAVSDDTLFIAEADRNRYTSATDALGFKYIFDYAQSVGLPCVASFSEGAREDFSDDTQLYYEVISNMVGEGRILVSSAGNESRYPRTYFEKPASVDSAGTFIRASSSDGTFVGANFLSADEFNLRIHLISGTSDHIFMRPTADILSDEDSLIMDTVMVESTKYVLFWNAYTPTGNYGDQILYQLFVQCAEGVGYTHPLAFSVEGVRASVECYSMLGYFVENALLPALCAGDNTHNVMVPGSAPDAICVGSTSHRAWFTDDTGVPVHVNWGEDGLWAPYSSQGPTSEGIVKPDVVANGTIISASSSFYYAKHGRSSWDLNLLEYEGRSYPWHVDCGTSMSAPVVAGIIALWLQANPRLTPAEVKDIIAQTSRHPDAQLEYPNNKYGYGEIDALAGLRLALAATGIEEVEKQEKASSSMSDGPVYNLQGIRVNSNYRGLVIRHGRIYTQK